MKFFKIWAYNPAKPNVPPIIVQERGVGWAVRGYIISKPKDNSIMYIEEWNGKRWVTVPFKLAPTEEELDKEWRGVA